MARSRNLKPGFFTNELLGAGDPLAQLLYAGLWCLADSTGTLEDRPARIKAEVHPYRSADVDALLDHLAAQGFVVRYQAEGRRLLYLPTFLDHQKPHYSERGKGFPPPAALQVSTNPEKVRCDPPLFPLPSSLNEDSLACSEPAPADSEPPEPRPCSCAADQNQGSGVRDQESGVRDQESGVRDQESGVRTDGRSALTPDSCLLTPGAQRLTPPAAADRRPGDALARENQGPGVRNQESGKQAIASLTPDSCLLTPETAVLLYPVVGGGKGPAEWPLTPAKLAEYRETFPALDVLAHCRRALQWCRDNPSKRKTARGMPAFLTRWLAREQDRGNVGPAPALGTPAERARHVAQQRAQAEADRRQAEADAAHVRRLLDQARHSRNGPQGRRDA